MARRTIVKLEDDIDGSPADETIPFAFDSYSYVIDLSADNARQFREAIERYAKVARRVGRYSASAQATAQRVPAAAAKSNASRDKAAREAVRAWAKSRGIEVSDRGRIAQSVVDQYEAEAIRETIGDGASEIDGLSMPDLSAWR